MAAVGRAEGAASPQYAIWSCCTYGASSCPAWVGHLAMQGRGGAGMTSNGGVRARVGHKRNPQIIVSSAYGWLPYTDPRGICRSGSSSVGHLPSTQMCGGRVIYTIRTQILLASVDVCRLRSATSQWLSTQMCGRGRLYKSVHRFRTQNSGLRTEERKVF